MQLTADTLFSLPVDILCTLMVALIGVTWRAANFARDNRDELRGLRDELRTTWSFRDQERWALQLERDNRKLGLFVPNVERAPEMDQHANG